MDNETGLETVLGSLSTAAASTVLSAVVGTPLAALLPVLAASLANGRHKQRVEGAIADIEARLEGLGDQLNAISDAQFKLINEAIVTILHSPDDRKVDYLKEAIGKSAFSDRLTMHEATLISRALRDVSVEELTFLIECQGQDIVFHENTIEGCINIKKMSFDGERATGLVALGLLTKAQGEGTWDDSGKYIFTPLAKKLLELVSPVND